MLCRYSEVFFKKGYAMKMNKQRLSHSGGLHPLEKTFQMVSTPGSEPGPNLFDI